MQSQRGETTANPYRKINPHHQEHRYNGRSGHGLKDMHYFIYEDGSIMVPSNVSGMPIQEYVKGAMGDLLRANGWSPVVEGDGVGT